MITTNRRQLLVTTGLVAIGGAISGCTGATSRGPSPTPGKPDLFVGTGGHGHTFPGASLPFGMAQLSPDTNTHRSEEHTSELQSLMRISYAVFCLKNKKDTQIRISTTT